MTIDNPTISDAAELWLERCRLDGLERATLRSYEGHFKHHIEQRIGDLLLKDLQAPDIRRYMDELLQTSSRAMTRKVLVSLRSLLSEAQSQGLIDNNPAREVKLRRSTRVSGERAIPSKDDIRAMLANVPLKHKPLIVTAIFTGMRSSEIRGLSWQHVDFERKVIQIRQRADRYNELGAPKSKSGFRDIPMSPLVESVLLEWNKHCPSGPLDIVFPNGAGNIESHGNITNRILRPLMVKCGLIENDGKSKFGFHALRHAAASLFIDQGWPPKKIQAILGHATIMMTFDVYGHLFQDLEGDVALMAKMEDELLIS